MNIIQISIELVDGVKCLAFDKSLVADSNYIDTTIKALINGESFNNIRQIIFVIVVVLLVKLCPEYTQQWPIILQIYP